ncbi:centrosomal protein of 135 kDa isoform X2 [Diorhabda carinulata]|uniref:centrosomal protein of 135 kDa isoform X2 n=1 Tax=Diorhabda carinulata TaxID=1163345 RepID=UPI0025A063CE|nr:centrosomal protein of 135 kDa isoform X2 [Diorhabda carinulata]
MEKSFAQVRKELDDLGYTETFRPECLPLIRRLLGDLKITTESLRKYMKISQQALEERDSLQLGAEPYKCDNAKLIKECNELHLAFIQFKEQHEKVQRDLRTKIISLENQLTDCGIEKQKLLDKLRDLQFDLKHPISKDNLQKSREQQSKTKLTEKSRQFHLSTAMASAESRVAFLSQEVKKLKDEQLHLLKNNDFLNSQLENRNEEIKRLNALLEGGRPIKAINKDCCYKNIDNKIGSLQDEIDKLKREKNSLQNQLTEALARQHEAMRRALNLAERNKLLEHEMKDIDQIALTVEAECNNTVKSNFEKVTKLQDSMNESLIKIQTLEMENNKLKLEKKELISEIETINFEKKNLQMLLETETEDKKRLTDRINNFTVIEQGLNMEIDRLLRLSGEQKRKIAELESEVFAGKLRSSNLENKTIHTRNDDASNIMKKQVTSTKESVHPKKPSSGRKIHKKTCKKSLTKSEPLAKEESQQSNAEKEKFSSVALQYDPQMGSKCCCEAGGCVKWMRELLEKDIKLRQDQATQQIESLRSEKEFYLKEYHKILEQNKSAPPFEKSSKVEELMNKIRDKDQLISSLQEDLKQLTSEKYSLTSRLEAQSRELSTIDLEETCSKTCCKRKARELEVHREEVKHLEKENISLKAKIQALNETSVFNEEQMKKAFLDMEQHIIKLENERRDLVITQSSSRSNIAHLEDDCQQLREKLKLAQIDANNQRANYDQLKILHDQSNRALADTQTQLLRAETELQGLQSKMNLSHRESSHYEREIARLQGDIEVMKSQLSKIDKEKDELLNAVDDKTEQIDRLETQLKEKRNQLSAMELENRDLKRQMCKINEESSSHEMESRNCRQTIHILQQDIDNERKLKEAALQENRRLQDDLSCVSLDCRDARKELEIAKRQVEDLKRQLQHYVAEVKRTEDLITQKELERTEILDQFKSLSQENNVLETTNHTLESEATQSRVQLSVALDHASDLERKVENQEALIKSYEKQISELSNQVASLEIQLKQGSCMTDRVSTELKQLKDLCVRLDGDKDDLKKKLRNQEDETIKIERQVDFLTRENKELKRALEKDHDSQEGLERLLKEARQEVIDQRLLNEDLQSEVNKMRKKIDELQERLTNHETTTIKNMQVISCTSPVAAIVEDNVSELPSTKKQISSVEDNSRSTLSSKASCVNNNRYGKYPYCEKCSSEKNTTTQLSSRIHPPQSKQMSNPLKELDKETCSDKKNTLTCSRILNNEFSHNTLCEENREKRNDQLPRSKKFYLIENEKHYSRTDDHTFRSRSYPSTETEKSETGQTEKNIADKKKTICGSYDEKRDSEKDTDAEQVIQVVDLGGCLKDKIGYEKLSERENKNIGKTTDFIKNTCSCLERNCDCCKQLLSKNREKSPCKLICKCHCSYYGDDILNQSVCCSNCPMNLQFQNIFYDKQCSRTNV